MRWSCSLATAFRLAASRLLTSTSSRASLPPLFYPQPVCHCHLCIALAATQPALEKRIINRVVIIYEGPILIPANG